jgi:hypothetical protein
MTYGERPRAFCAAGVLIMFVDWLLRRCYVQIMATSFKIRRFASLIFSLIFSLAALAIVSGCSSGTHTTEVVLPGGINCRSETSGSFFNRSRNMQCTDSNGKVIGAYKSY